MAKKKIDKMQQLAKSDNSIIRDLRDQQWLYNPRVFAQVSGDFSLMHQRVLLGVLDKLQDRIILSATAHKDDPQLWLPLFSPEEMNSNIDFEIEAKDLGVAPGHYPELVDALRDLLSIRMGYLRKVGNKTEYNFVNLFSRLQMQVNDSGLRTGRIRVKMDKENVNDFLSMNHGYTDHAARIGQIAKKQRTPRIYIYLSTFRDYGHKEVSYPEFCEFLGVDDDNYLRQHEGEKAGLKATDNPFHKFSKVKKLILEPSRVEMDNLSANLQIDFSFTYEPKYNDGRLRGNPTHIAFTIVLGPLGIERDFRKRRRSQEQSLVNTLMVRCPELKPSELAALLRDVQDTWFDEFRQYAYEDIQKAVERKQPDHVADYMLTLMRTWIDDRSRLEQRKVVEQQRQYRLFQKQEAEEKWVACFADIAASIPVTARQLAFCDFGEADIDGNRRFALTLWVENAQLVDRLESNEYLAAYEEAIRKHYGGVAVQYRVMG